LTLSATEVGSFLAGYGKHRSHPYPSIGAYNTNEAVIRAVNERGSMKIFKVLREHRIMFIVLIGFLVIDVFLLGVPNFGVYDEAIYVPVAYNMMSLKPQPAKPTILGNPVTLGTPLNLSGWYPKQPFGKDFSVEQPPLAKLIIGAFLYTFAPDTVNYFWARVPSVIMSIIALVSMYGIAFSLFESKRWALLSMVFLNFDTLFWVHSRIALLDIYGLAFMMLGTLLYLRNRMHLSAVCFALSILSKLTGVFGFIGILIYHLLSHHDKANIKRVFASMGICAIVCVVVYTVYSWFWGMDQNPIANFMLYVTWMKGVNWTFTLVQGSSPVSQPWAWLFNDAAVRYAQIFDPATGIPLVSIWGRLNPALIFLTVPVFAYTGYEMIKQRKPVNALPFVWFMATWLPWFFLTLSGAEQFIHHMVGVIPAVVLGVVAWLRTQSRVFQAGFSMFVFAAWAWSYPYMFLWLYVTGARYALPHINFFFGN